MTPLYNSHAHAGFWTLLWSINNGSLFLIYNLIVQFLLLHNFFKKNLKSFLSFKSPLLPLYLGSLHFSPLFWHLNHSLSKVSFSSSSFSNLVLEWFEMQISSEFFPLSPSRPSFFLISNSKFLSMVHKSVRTNVVAYLTSVISCSFLTDTRELEAS